MNASSKWARRGIMFGLTLAAAWTGFQLMFATFAECDDEGYVMLSLVRFMRGDALYDATYTQYGPAFFFLHRWLHEWTQWPVSHDVVRLKSLGCWLATAWLGSWFVYRVTSSHVMGLAAFLVAFFQLDKFCIEPGHPQELCVLLSTLLLTISTFVRPRAAAGEAAAARCESETPSQRPSLARIQSAWHWIAVGIALGGVGAVAGILAAVKVNVGGLAWLAAVLPLLALREFASTRISARWQRVGFVTVGGASCLLPWALTFRSLPVAGAWKLPLLCSLSCGCVLAAARVFGGARSRASAVRPGWFAALACVCATTVAAAALFLVLGVADGTSWSGMYQGVIGQHRGFTTTFMHAAPFPNFIAVVSGLSTLLLVVLLASRSGTESAGAGREIFAHFAWAAPIAGAGMLAFVALFGATQPLTGGLAPRRGLPSLAALAGPLVWLLIYGAASRQDGRPTQAYARCALGIAAALWPLTAYPTPGSQLSLSTLPISLAVLVGLSDSVRSSPGLSRLSRLSPYARSPFSSVSFRPQSLLLAVLCAALLLRGACFAGWRQQQAAIDLPGATLLRMPPRRAETQRWVARTLREHCDTFVFAQHGMNRFYFWTGIDPPTACNPTFWPHLLTDRQQEKIVEALERHRRVCVVDIDYAATLPDGPLRDYIRRRFSLLDQRDGVRILVRTADA